MTKKTKIIITEDKPEYRKMFAEMLAPYPIEIIAEAENGQQLLKMLATKQSPEVILLDLEMPVMDGNQTFELICKTYPDAKVIILSQHFEEVLIENYLERGARGYLPKDAVVRNELLLVNAISKVADGGTFIYEKSEGSYKFTHRQKEMLPLIFDGLTNEAIAEETGIGTRAVEKQRQKIYLKSGSDKPVSFYKYAFSRGLQFLMRVKKRKK